ncbi:hypothetical protein [Paracidobacterium acidisoli]|uniref:Uncharacterized protein n=1 Tax=Paracidobacterium acidisoli TaxID=2303751 RepID=A0A372IT30_9BACT|nr:hypothetical protein [Paracidobacterium acidisoli]MBT9330479.1 hypothetical protein [Paracidobacterium acidisoli]
MLPGRLIAALILALALSGFAAPLYAQGCSMCRDTTAGSAPRMRQGLRRGIIVLGAAAGVVFVTILLVARGTQPREDEPEASRSYRPLPPPTK